MRGWLFASTRIPQLAQLRAAMALVTWAPKSFAADKKLVSGSGIAALTSACAVASSGYEANLWPRRFSDHVRRFLPGAPRSSPKSEAIETHAEIG